MQPPAGGYPILGKYNMDGSLNVLVDGIWRSVWVQSEEFKPVKKDHAKAGIGVFFQVRGMVNVKVASFTWCQASQ